MGLGGPLEVRAGGEAAPVVKTMQHITHISTGPTIDAGAFFSPSAPPYRGGRPTGPPGDVHDRGDWSATEPIRDATRRSLALQAIAAGLLIPRGLVETAATRRGLDRTIPIVAAETGRSSREVRAPLTLEIRRARRGR